jgi:E3 ubiquitin-protein ligase HUWE1
VNALILAIQDAPQDELAAILSTVQVWHWPRTDLHYWIKPLNRFDSILDEICKNYHVVDNTIQVNEFTPRTKELILAILRFTRLLLDNATNRKLYSSFDVSVCYTVRSPKTDMTRQQRMNDLLLTQDLDVLESVLRLIFRRAQQIAANGQLHSADTFNLTANRIKDLTSGWNAVRQAGLTMLDWVREDLGSKQMPKDVLEVDFRFYRKAATEGETTKIASKEQHEKEASASTSVSTPSINRTTSSRMSRTAPASAPVTPAKGAEISDSSDLASEGLANIHLGVVAEQGQSAPSLVADAVEMHRLPSEEKLHLLQRIRVSMAAPHLDSRQQMLRIRLLAIAVLGQ